MYGLAGYLTRTVVLVLLVYLVSADDCTSDLVKLQLSWTKQAQFAGYYAAIEKNYFLDECLEVFIDDGGPFVDVEHELNIQKAHFGSFFTSKYLVDIQNPGNQDLIQIAQIHQTSGYLLMALANRKLTSPLKIGIWPGLEVEPVAFLEINNKFVKDVDYKIVAQTDTPFKILQGDADMVSAMTYNEYAMLLRSINPDTNRLFQKEDFGITHLDNDGGGMLPDALFMRKSWYELPANQDIVLRFLKGVVRGWMFCRDNVEACVRFLNPPDVDAAIWQLNEINSLIWTGTDRIGELNLTKLETTINSLQAIDLAPSFPNLTSDFFNTDIIKNAYAALEADHPNTTWDFYGKDYRKQELSWCLKEKKEAVLCGGITQSSSGSRDTPIIIGLTVGLGVGFFVFIFFALLVALLIVYLLKKNPRRMRVSGFKDFKSLPNKSSYAKTDFQSLLKNFDFVAMLTKTSSISNEASDIRKAIVYFHINNGSILDLFDYFLVAELDKQNGKKNYNFDLASSSVNDLDNNLDTSCAIEMKEMKTKKKEKTRKKGKMKKTKKLNKKNDQSNDQSNVERPALFREDSLVTDIFRYYSQIVGLYYIWYVLSFPVAKLEKYVKKQEKKQKKKGSSKHPASTLQVFGMSVEVDPKKISLGDATINKLQLQIVAQQIFVSIVRSIEMFPQPMSDLLKKVEERVNEKCNSSDDGKQMVEEALANFVFLRYICSALVSPHDYGLLNAPPSNDTRRVLILLSKVLQNLANGSLFEKEEYMTDLNDFIKTNLQPMKKFLHDVLEVSGVEHQKMVTSVPVNIEDAGLSILYHYCSDNRSKLSKVLFKMNAETGWVFDEIFPSESSDESESELV